MGKKKKKNNTKKSKSNIAIKTEYKMYVYKIIKDWETVSIKILYGFKKWFVFYPARNFYR